MTTPILSYGIILLYIDDNNQIWYLLSQRRDTIEYAEFLRGRYSVCNLTTYFNLMTMKERYNLINYTFDELWDDLWVNKSNSYYTEMKMKAEKKFNFNYSTLIHYLNNTSSSRLEPGWGFPKGRRNFRENEIQCAIREFIEESQISIDHTNLLNISPFKEVFKGSNDIMYGTVYYLALSKTKIPKQIMYTPNCLREYTISEEIADIKWCTLGEALILLPPWRQKLLIDIEICIRKYFGSEKIDDYKI